MIPMNYSNYILFFLILAITSCSEKKQKIKESNIPYKNEEKTSGVHDVLLTFEIIGSKDTGYGYTIMIDNRLFINQPNIPGQPGNKGFDTKEKANKVALLVIDKIKKKQIPPTVSKAELDSLQVLSAE
jgi:hypothetical protein